MKIQKNQNGFTLVEGLLIAIVITMISGVGYFVYSTNNKDKSKSRSEEASQITKKIDSAQQEPIDATKAWKAYSSKEGGFSLKYPGEWIEAQNSENCPEIFARGATEESRGICQSDAVSQISLFSVEGDEVESRAPDPQYATDIESSELTVGSVKGKKHISKTKDNAFLADGTKFVEYLFFTNGKTYIASYSDGGGKFKNVEKEFDLMITKTLKFNP